jgi:biotin carboxylase
VDRFGYGVVIACRDSAIARLLERPLAVPTVPAGGAPLARLVDKFDLGVLCREVDARYPRTWMPRDEREDAAAISAAGLPLLVKPARSANATPDAVVHLVGARVAGDEHAAAAAIAALRRAGSVPLVQASVAGEKLQVALIRRAGETTFRFAQRHLRRPGSDYEEILETLPVDRGTGAEAAAMLERICDGAGYQGLVQAEFLRADRDGEVYVIDVNPRLWGSVAFTERLGLRVVERAVLDALGAPSPAGGGYPVGRRYHSLLDDLRYVRGAPRRRLAEVARVSSPLDVWHGPSPTDPLPIVTWLGRATADRVAGRRRGW